MIERSEQAVSPPAREGLGEGGPLEQQRIRTERLRWHSRRALLENDLVLQRFWQAQSQALDEEQARQLECLLAMEDHDLWELLSGRRAADPALRELVELLQQPTRQ